MTAETAAVMPLLVAVALAMVWLIGLGVAQVAVTDAAREAARAVARGDSVAEATLLAQRVAPGAQVSVSTEEGLVVVRVERRVQAAGALLDSFDGARVHAEAVALSEGEPP